jgi:hypothetical protein
LPVSVCIIAGNEACRIRRALEWLLGLDADEEISPDLREEIQSAIAAPENFPAFCFPRCTNFCDRWIRHGDWYPDRQTRLWLKGSARWGGVDPHDKLIVDGKVGRLRGNLLHYPAETIDRQIAKISSYSNDFLRDAQSKNHGAAFGDLTVRPLWRFLRSYFFRLGFLDGWQGCYIAWMTAFYTATRYAKVWDAQQKKPDDGHLNHHRHP